MFATVKKIKDRTLVEVNGGRDMFIGAMHDFIGKKIEVDKHNICKEWYFGEGWAWHESWLDFGTKKKVAKKKVPAKKIAKKSVKKVAKKTTKKGRNYDYTL